MLSRSFSFFKGQNSYGPMLCRALAQQSGKVLKTEIAEHFNTVGEGKSAEISICSDIPKIYSFNWDNPNKAARFEIGSNEWQKINFCGSLRERGRFALANIGMHIVISGGEINRKISKDCQLIDLSAERGNVTKVSAMKTKRVDHCSLAIEDKIYVFGGWNDSGGLSSIECFDEKIGVWAPIGNLHEIRWGATATVLDGSVFVIGGNQKGGNQSVERFDPLSGKCEAVAPMKQARWRASSAKYKGKIYVAGGYDADSISTVEIYDPQTDRWMEGPTMNKGRWGFQLISHGSHLFALGSNF